MTRTQIAHERPQAGPGDLLMAIAWRDCLMWAARQNDIRAAFENETGMRFGSSPFDQMIDQATGFDEAIAVAFIRWFNENIWGQE